ncbi:spore coat protein [Clostridium polyendosporum]|uniref:Spore coat protein n=1 Tax=Clostridium polyendosporum TaxID=69208 RepID=A0A919VGX3_9CLOT|nr:spore coat protein [Clostridium polyendosporum]
MEIGEIIEIVKKNYGIVSNSCKKIKNIYKISTEDEDYCLKVIDYQYPHFHFILSAIQHLQKKGFKTIPQIIKTCFETSFISLGEKYAYLTPWVISRESNYDNPIDLLKASLKLSELHVCSEGFNITKKMKPRIGWLRWGKIFGVRGDEILDFRKRIYQKAYKSEFDKLYLSIMDEELKRVEWSIKNLLQSNYLELMKKEVMKRGFCHHDYAHHNVLVNSTGEINIIDFDYCILDTHLHDLASLLIRSMKDGKWDLKKAFFIFDAYAANKRIDQDEIPIMAAFVEFPQQYWQLGIQYYWEQQPWEEEFFIKKLMRYIYDREERQEFVNELRKAVYLGGS